MGFGEDLGNSFAGGVDNLLNGSTHSLESFLTNFTTTESKLIKQLDPLNTFDVFFKFYPTLTDTKTPEKQNWLGKLKDAGTKFLKNSVNNAVENLTGGLASAFMNSNVKVLDKMKQFGDYKTHSFMEYLADANLLTPGRIDYTTELFSNKSDANKVACPLEISLGTYVQRITLPNLKVFDGPKLQNLMGNFQLTNMIIGPDNNTLTMSIINTKVPLHERIFYPWMKEITLPYWSYEDQPYTTATITIDFTAHADVKYVFYGCRPTQVQTIQPTHEPSGDALVRDVTFLFDTMFVESDLQVSENATGKLLGAATKLIGSAGNMLNL